MIDWPPLITIIVATLTLFGARWALQRWREARAREAWRKEIAQWQAQQPPIVEPTAEQLAELRRRIPELALPALILTANESAPVTAGGTRIGGPVWLPNGVGWPAGKEGRPLEFVAQLDFAAMPPLPDYPEAGVLQLFVGRDDLHGADFDAPDKSDFRLVWHPEGAVGGQLLPPLVLPHYGEGPDGAYSTPAIFNDQVRSNGVMLHATARSMVPPPFSYPFDALISELGIDARHPDVDAQLEQYWNAGSAQGHYTGGHPQFVQFDYRGDASFPPRDDPQPSPYRDYDRVLFQLTSDNGLQWGDVGEANVLIRRDDLLGCRFDRAIWYWDCS